MIELDERDIKAVASNRLIRRYRWYLVGSVVLCLAGALGLESLLQEVDAWRKYLPLIPVAALGIGLILFLKKISKEEKSLVREWKKE